MQLSAVGAGALLFDAVLGEVVPTLALEASGGFAFGSFYPTSFVTDGKAICYGSVSCVSIIEREE